MGCTFIVNSISGTAVKGRLCHGMAAMGQVFTIANTIPMSVGRILWVICKGIYPSKIVSGIGIWSQSLTPKFPQSAIRAMG